MGADYYCYTEIKRNGEWHALNGKYYNEQTGDYNIGETYWSGSRSYFSRTYDKLRDIGSIIQISELSKEVLEREDWLDPKDTYNNIVAVSLSDLRKSLPKTNRHECCGYVHKTHLWNYENDNAEIEEWLSGEEYNELSDAEKKEYEFFEWDDPMNWPIHLRDILNIVNHQVREYMRANEKWNEPTDIRLVCIASY